MGQVRVDVGGRSYPLACKDGEEEIIDQLARTVDAKAQQLSAQLGHLPEVRMLLMSAIMVADDLIRGRTDAGGNTGTGAEAATSREALNSANDSAAKAAAALAEAASRVEQVTASLEAGDIETDNT